MEYSDCLIRIQSFLENAPLIVLGSGASCEYGLPLMSDIRSEILTNKDEFIDPRFAMFCDNLKKMNLEEAMDESHLSIELSNQIRNFVWRYVNEKDIAFFQRLTSTNRNFAVVDILRTVLQPSSNSAIVVTTNYDRVAEYAADVIGATVITGFEGNLIRKVEFPSARVRKARICARERTVHIWKVHGSLDWFEDATGEIVSYPMTSEIPPGYKPLIIPPGKDKYSSTHNDPFRDVIAHADSAFSQAGSFICVGYGFNDEHIQPKLIAQIKAGKPIVVLCFEATEACKRNVISDNVTKYAVIEHIDGGKTAVTCSANAGKTEEYDVSFWNLPGFINTIWGQRYEYF